MAITVAPAGSLAQTVKEEINSPETTTPLTLKLLSALLGSGKTIDPVVASKPVKRRDASGLAESAGKLLPKDGSRSTKPIKSRVPAKVVIYTAPDTSPSLSTDAQKLALATETFNKTLKNLSTLAKSKGGPRAIAKDTQCASDTPARPKTPGDGIPLRETSPNRCPRPLSPQKPKQKPPLCLAPSESSIIATAECARTALKCLRDLEKTKKETHKSQLDQASLVLLDNLNQLALANLATQEIAILRERLDQKLHAEAGTSTPSRDTGCRKSARRLESVGEALRFDVVPISNDLCTFVISFQRHVLKTIAVLGPNAINQSVVEAFELRYKYGPHAVIVQGYKSNSISAEKAGIYLQALARVVSSLCLSGASPSIKAAGGSLSPALLFQLQLAALEIQCSSWTLTNAQIDMERGVWAPLLRIVAKFCQNSCIAKTEQYSRARDGVQRLKRVLKPVSTDAAIGSEPEVSISVTECLAKLAQDCGNHADSVDLLQRSLESSEDTRSLSGTICRCKIAALRLQAYADNPRAALGAAEDALTSLKGPITGTARELEDLLLHGVRLRKRALDTLMELEKSAAFVPLVDVQVKIRTCTIRIIFAFLNFVSRYIGTPPLTSEASVAHVEQFHAKVRRIRSIGETTISNALTAARSAIGDPAPTWADADSALNDCHAVAKILDVAKEPNAGDKQSETTSSTYLKISNLYWLRFLRQKENVNESTDILTLLKNSIRVLEDRPDPERLAGFLAAKHEKIASVYMDMGRHEKASVALENAISTHVSTGGFSDVVKTRSSQSMRLIWDSNASAIFALGKTLTAYVKLILSSYRPKSCDQEFYDDQDLPINERIALLEKQLFICMTLKPTLSKLDPVPSLVRLIIGLYHPSQTLFKVQLLLGVLKYSSLHHNDRLENVLEELLTDEKLRSLELDLSAGSSGSPCAVLLVALLRLQWTFKKSRPSTKLLLDMVDQWSILVSHSEHWQILENHLDDPSILSSQLQAIIDYTDMQSLEKVRLGALLLQEKMLASQEHRNEAALVRSLVQKSLQYGRTGSAVAAERALVSARKCIDSVDLPPSISLVYHLAHAEHLLDICSFQDCVQALEDARSCYAAAFPVGNEDEKQHLSLSQSRILCQSTTLMSRRELKRGNLNGAIFLAKQCLRLSSQIWAGLQKMEGHVHLRKTQEGNESTLDSLVEDLSSMNISNNPASERPATKGAAFWPYVSVHCEALMHLSYLLGNCGLYQDAIYYAEKGQRVAESVNSPAYIAMTSTLLLAHRRKGDDPNAGPKTSNTMRPPLEIEVASIAAVGSSVYLAEASISAGEYTAASEAIEEAAQRLSAINLRNRTTSADPENDELPDASVVFDSMETKPKGRMKNTKKCTRGVAQVNGARARGKTGRAPTVKTLAKGEPPPMITSTRLETTINMLRAYIMLSSGDQDALSLLAALEASPLSGQDLVRQRLMEARSVLDKSFKELSTGAVHCVLAETAIAFPSVERDERASGKQAILQSPVTTKTPSRGRGTRAADSRRPNRHNTDADQPSHLVKRAAQVLMDAVKSTSGSCPTNLLREVCTTLNQCFMLSSVLLPQRICTPAQVALQAATPNCSAMTRERWVIMTDARLREQSDIISWPGLTHADKTMDRLSVTDASPREASVLDKLPEDWDVISMQLNRTRDELSLIKLHAGQPPFSLCIPLCRSTSDEPDQADFGFAMAKNQLLDIIHSANKSSHDSSNQLDKQARRSWWAEREVLDDRLKILLENIENIWLGGFRGILTHQPRHRDLLARFAASFLRSLDQHLPSRQKNRRTIDVDLHLHAHVLELFVALGHPDEHDLDDSIADLLYFVVDILQFQGEQNAYDEIDIDMITVDVLDALRCYHEAVEVSAAQHTQHTILILDKELLAFPWESLPCLDGRPVSRMPSLNCLEARLDKMRLQAVDSSALTVSATSGTYVLNPSSDLTSTQSTFEAPFSTTLANFTPIINRAPTEAEFESSLRRKDLFLYFGHGSGAQYVRGRNIKRLDRCAVAFLMGCSSGKMVECGAFEPYGVPWDYMHANSPAVVGTLWDVTDKDIDRFAMKTFTEWGLLEEEDKTGTEEGAHGGKRRGRNGKAKGKGKVGKHPRAQCAPSEKSAPNTRQPVALDEAVANARGSCVLRYLNGAAPVIYGIPVVLG